jgi:hypothetical protein
MSKNTSIADLINYISVDGSGNVVLSTGQLVATQNYVTTAVSNLVASAPSTLDTLNELATALGNDANFATTVTTSIGTKLNLSGGTLTGALNGTSALFTDNLRTDTGLGIKYGSFVSTTGYLNLFSARVGSTFTINFKDGTGGFESALSFTNSANRNYTFPNADGTIALTSNLSSYLPLTGGTLTGALSGTSATFSGVIRSDQTNGLALGSISGYRRIQYDSANTRFVLIRDDNGLASLEANSATFSSSVTASGGFEIPNGQFYRARRSSSNLLTDMIGIPSGSDDVRVLTTGAFNVINGATNSMFYVRDNGNVGIGTSTPEGPLHINGAIGGGYIGMAISNFSNTIGTTSGIDFGSDASTCYNGAGNGQIAVTNVGGTSGGQSSEMNLRVWTGSALVTGIKINNAGRVSFPTATAQNYGQSNASAVTITNGTSGTIASCTITSVGKPIFVNLTGDINPIGGASWCYVYIYRNGGQIGKYIIAESTASSANVPFALSVIDVPGAGNHTYTGYVTVNGASPIIFGETGNGQAPTILAIELI